ncbi:MAG: site-specific integrase [Actinobacteria bacterium]|nr:site-specific integrase [Actinomycetota bacterium]
MGFIEKRSGGYRARYRDPLGRLTSKTFTRKADAERWTKEMEVAVERGDWLDPRSAQVPLAAGIAPSSVHRHYRLLRRMLQVAVQKQKLQANPCDRVEPPRVPKTEMTFLTWEQAVDLAEAHQERYRALIYLAVDSGMRWSELIGLRRARIDLVRRKVRVTEQMIRLKGGKWHRKEPKTPASIRSIIMSAVTAELLTEHVNRFVLAGPDALVFANTVGSPLISSSFWQHHFSKGLQAAGVSCRFHDLRHTSVALAIAEGAHPKAIQTRMGHSTINVTLDRYGHLSPELDEAIATSFGERLLAARRQRDNVVQARFGE